MTGSDEVRRVSRRLRDVVEPIAANVYFAPEAQAAYKELGLSYLPGYFCSRSACMGGLPGEVVASTFGVFNPDLVVPAVAEGWSKTDPASILAARQRGAVASLDRILDGPDPAAVARATELLRRGAEAARPEGRPIYSGLRSLGWPGDPLGDLWRAADLVREHRGDSHTCAWVAHGVSAMEITLLTELWWGIPLGSYVLTRGFSAEQAEAAIQGLQQQGLVDGERRFTAGGEKLRAAIEEATDRGEAGVVAGLGGDADELIGLLEPWAKSVVAAGGYPVDPSSHSRQ
ncbi:MAG TPA: hypothetical protein VKI64_08265 [Acidimicrobiales bacterium]|nr:hypothetical protein [Acidimicrobiales bacterium]